MIKHKEGKTLMSISIKDYIVHILDNTTVMPIISNALESNNEEFKDYLAKTIEKSFYSDDVKTCYFTPTSNISQICHEANWDLKTISTTITNELFFIMHRNPEIPKADCVFGFVNIDNNDFLFMLKLDHKESFTHFVKTENNKPNVHIITNSSLLPALPPKISEGFFVSLNDSFVKVLESKCLVDGIKDYYLSTQILRCTENSSPKQKTTRLLHVAKKVADLYYSAGDNMEQHISSTIFNELQSNESLSVRNLGTKFFASNPVAQQEFFDRLSTVNISKDETLSLSEKFQRKFYKQAIKSKSGIEIKIPTQLYSNVDEVEFINNSDGTISIVIKNISL